MPEDDVNYCGRCKNAIPSDAALTVVRSSDAPEQILCGSCTEALHRELWDGP
ncbi:hypothetical protein GCM10027273_09340 [Nocardioides pakistanensis]